MGVKPRLRRLTPLHSLISSLSVSPAAIMLSIVGLMSMSKFLRLHALLPQLSLISPYPTETDGLIVIPERGVPGPVFVISTSICGIGDLLISISS